MVRVATWNVNSVKARLAHLTQWLRDSAPDIVCLQELKCVSDEFPRMEIEDLGYNLAVHGQKTYNGVAILSKYPLDDIITALPGDAEDEQARYIEAVVSVKGGVLRVASVYVPNGQDPQSDKFAYKLRFLDRLRAHAATLAMADEACVIGGDYNVAPYAPDVYAPKALDGTVCYHPLEREKLRALLHSGWYDAFRSLHPAAQQFTWWDYRGGGYEHGKGLRIDHLLLSPRSIDRLQSCEVDETTRKLERPSDHAPVVATLEFS